MDIPISPRSSQRLSSQLPASDGNTARKPAGSAPTSVLNSFSSRRQEALQIFEQTLAMGYEKLKASQGPAAQFKQFEPLTAEKVAGNILGFIERRLQMDLAGGATLEELQTRLEAGLTGFEKGFAEASEKLHALSLLSPEIEQDIGKTYELVLAGIDRLREEFLTGATQPESVKPIQGNVAGPQVKTLLASSSYQYALAESFSFQLVTAEGDKVTISASSSRSYAFEQGFAAIDKASGPVAAQSSTASYSANSSMSWSVAGDLNEVETQAIKALFDQIDKLAESFFKGNIDQAFDQALELGYDREQITAFSLNLAQVEVQRVSSAYREFNGAPVESFAPDLYEHLLPLGNFIRNLLEAMDAASAFQRPQQLLTELAEKLVAPDTSEFKPGERLGKFVEQVVTDLKL